MEPLLYEKRFTSATPTTSASTTASRRIEASRLCVVFSKTRDATSRLGKVSFAF